MKTIELIEDLIQRTKEIIKSSEKLKTLSELKLNKKDNSESWSILECIEHLNLYGRFYLPEIKNRMEGAKQNPALNFKSGVLGNYFSKSMLPKEKLNAMKTFKEMNPINSVLKTTVLDEFMEQQNTILELLETAKNYNLKTIKTSISISKLIKLRLGDTFRVVIYHNQRHISQAEKLV